MGFLDSLFQRKPNSAKSYYREGTTGDDSPCKNKESVIRSRIEQIAAEDWPSYELRKDIPAFEIGGASASEEHGFAYGFYLDGQPRLMIMILEQNQYRDNSVQRAHATCKKQGIASFHLMKHLPNRKTYIAERIRALMP